MSPPPTDFSTGMTTSNWSPDTMTTDNMDTLYVPQPVPLDTSSPAAPADDRCSSPSDWEMPFTSAPGLSAGSPATALTDYTLHLAGPGLSPLRPEYMSSTLTQSMPHSPQASLMLYQSGVDMMPLRLDIDSNAGAAWHPASQLPGLHSTRR